MIRILAVDQHHPTVHVVQSLVHLNQLSYDWCWIDISEPTDEETNLLERYFHFHPLAIEDCIHLLQRPKLDYYPNELFFVLHSIQPNSLEVQEVNLFYTPNAIITYHLSRSQEIDEAWTLYQTSQRIREKGMLHALYVILDKLVDEYFPSIYALEEQLDDIESGGTHGQVQALLDHVFRIRTKLLKIRKTVVPMRELLYRIINTEKIDGLSDQLIYFRDVYDHLIKLSDLIDANRELTADLRDSYLSVNSYRMNTIMKTLTVITTIFMPLTFLAGIYGMNFDFMPELTWKWGYFAVLGTMFFIGFSMYLWFKLKKWFD